ncbi:phage tail protein I [Aeromonas salmonicida]|uniref:phage tail protein I n=2 Tax=Aeromonas salmonicida TaxID=645 RepID=UPI0023ED072D|nr:phage tail protein I [Aeromonas salmonicida]
MTLLPPCTTKLERHMTTVAAAAVEIPIPCRDLWSPATCPSAALPYQAWAFSVDDWDDAWSEQQKRGAMAASYQVHATKGTPGAVRRALDAIGYRAVIKQWFDYGGAPYTFKVRVNVPPEGIVAGNTAAITRRIDAAKNLRSHYTLSLVMSTDVSLGIAAVPSITPRYICRPYQASLPITFLSAPMGGMPRIAATYKVSAV